MSVSFITTHILDTTTGKPASGVPVALLAKNSDGWETIGESVTDADGRVKDLGPEALETGTYRLEFQTASYFKALGTETFFPEVVLTFSASADEAHYHVPLLLSPFSFSSYRGS